MKPAPAGAEDPRDQPPEFPHRAKVLRPVRGGQEEVGRVGFHGLRIAGRCYTRGYKPSLRWSEEGASAGGLAENPVARWLMCGRLTEHQSLAPRKEPDVGGNGRGVLQCHRTATAVSFPVVGRP